MATLDSAFWHKSQRQFQGTMPMTRFTLAQNTDEQLTWAVTEFMINGVWGTLTASGSAGSGTLINTTNYSAGLHANNPAKTKETETGEVSTLQNFLGLAVPAVSQVYCIVTCSGAPSDLATTKTALHFYAGEIVLNTLTARRPDLDFSDECPLAEILYVNTTAGALAVAAGATKELMTITDIAMVKTL